jgi:diguanylate cyclase (GGDEF)-like protein
MCDVDFFKKYNDQYGHQAGDACLQAVAESIRRRVRRPSDLTARYGGEEFTVILPDTDLEGARHIAEAICQELTLMGIAHNRSSVAPIVTISCGIACMFPSTDNRPQMLIERADQALYRAKQEGRNRVVSFEEPAANPA